MKKYNLAICYSSGIDSLTALYYAVTNMKYSFQDIILIMFNYGQPYFEKEYGLLRELLKNENIPVNYKVLDINIEDDSKLLDHYCWNRNTIFSTIACRFSDEVWIVANGDESQVKDKDEKFFDLATQLNSYTMEKPILIHSPFLKLRKSNIIKWGINNCVPYFYSTSCYHETKIHCGECAGCLFRWIDMNYCDIYEKYDIHPLDVKKNQEIVKQYLTWYKHKNYIVKLKEELDIFYNSLKKHGKGVEFIKCFM